MITLIIVLCRFTEPIGCEILRLVPDSATPIGCLLEGQERAARWLDDHPRWELVHTICEKNVAPQRPA